MQIEWHKLGIRLPRKTQIGCLNSNLAGEKKRTIEKKSDCEIANKRHDLSANVRKNANWAHEIQAKDPF